MFQAKQCQLFFLISVSYPWITSLKSFFTMVLTGSTGLNACSYQFLVRTTCRKHSMNVRRNLIALPQFWTVSQPKQNNFTPLVKRENLVWHTFNKKWPLRLRLRISCYSGCDEEKNLLGPSWLPEVRVIVRNYRIPAWIQHCRFL